MLALVCRCGMSPLLPVKHSGKGGSSCTAALLLGKATLLSLGAAIANWSVWALLILCLKEVPSCSGYGQWNLSSEHMRMYSCLSAGGGGVGLLLMAAASAWLQGRMQSGICCCCPGLRGLWDPAWALSLEQCFHNFQKAPYVSLGAYESGGALPWLELYAKFGIWWECGPLGISHIPFSWIRIWSWYQLSRLPHFLPFSCFRCLLSLFY